MVEVAPAGCKLDEFGDCPDDYGEHTHPIDSRDGTKLFGGAFLPHSCNYWVIGGPQQIRCLIRDLEAALVRLGP
jgi:hypothetical protein